MLHQKTAFFLLCLCSLLEVLAQTYLSHYGNKDVAAIVYLIAGVAIGVLPLLPIKNAAAFAEKMISARWMIAAFVLLGVGLFVTGCDKISRQPLDYTFADMLPVIQIMGERWIAGEDVYAVIPDIWEGMTPVYLPVMWMAYVPALLVGVDIRITNLILLILTTGLILQIFRKPQQRPLFSVAIFLPLLLLLAYVFITYSTFITISEEPVVVFFYCLLAYAVLRERKAWVIVALVGCLLSRYTLVFWAMSYLGYGFFYRDRRTYLYLIIATSLSGLVLMLVSQGIYKIDLFLSLKDAYVNSITDPDRAWSAINTASKNIGLARFVAYEHFIYLHTALVWGSVLLPLALFTLYHFRLRERVAFSLFAICSLKLCVVYFFNVNPLPYSYLFYTSTFLSLVLISQYSGGALSRAAFSVSDRREAASSQEI